MQNFDIATLVLNNSTSAKRDTAKSKALESGKSYMQISVRHQRGKDFINAILYVNNKDGITIGKQLDKKTALATLISYCKNDLLADTVYSVDETLVKEMQAFLAKASKESKESKK